MQSSPAHEVTIVLTHRGYSWYLPYTLRRARASNPHARIILITDQKSVLLSRFAELVSLKDHLQEAEAFASLYKHLSPNPYDFELFCFQRWFLLNSVAKKHGIGRCFYLDSDVLLFSDLSQIEKHYRAVQMTVNYEQGPYSCFINSRAVLSAFCDFMMILFRDHHVQMAADYRSWQEAGSNGGISDMHAMKHFIKAQGIKVSDTSEIVNDSTFDTVIHEANGYATTNGRKIVQWENGHPYVLHLALQKKILFHTFHMQGSSKALILDYHQLGRFWPFVIGLYNRFRR
jgi:hypothetical protein